MPDIRPRKNFTDAFKAEAVRLLEDSGKSVAEVARDLGIRANLLYRWRSEEHQATRACTSRGAVKAEREELARLRRENAVLRQERDFLRSAAAYFAKERK